MLLSHYCEGLLAHFPDVRIRRNITTMLERMVEHTSIRLWSISTDVAEFTRSKRLLDGSLKAVLAESTVTEALREVGSREVTVSDDDRAMLLVLHDPSDIRKPYAADLECLGIVRALNGQRVPGYQTFNTVVLDELEHTPQPVDCSVYSTGDPHYVTEEELAQYARWLHAPAEPSPLSSARIQAIRQYLAEDSALNLYWIASRQLRRVVRQLRRQHPHRVRCHILDRQFDGVRYVRLIAQVLHDRFILRLKGSRTVPGLTWSGHPNTVSVQDVPCPHVAHYDIGKVRLRHTTYQNVTCYLEWGPFCLEGHTYTMVRITLCDRRSRPIFDHAMVLLTNLSVRHRADARGVYRLYLLRGTIEGVFKFCKTGLGWEEAQVRDYASIRRLLTLTMYLAGYFYAIHSDLIEDPVITQICLLGGSKGRVTRHFFLEGLRKLLIYRSVCDFRRALRAASLDDVTFEDMMAFLE